jgi:hypothetical protein
MAKGSKPRAGFSAGREVLKIAAAPALRPAAIARSRHRH